MSQFNDRAWGLRAHYEKVKNTEVQLGSYERRCQGIYQEMSVLSEIMLQVKPNVIAYKYNTSTYRPMECLNMGFVGPYPDKDTFLL